MAKARKRKHVAAQQPAKAMRQKPASSQRAQPPTTKRKWNPCDDGIKPIIAALESVIHCGGLDLHERIQYQATCLSHQLAGALTEPGGGRGSRTAGRREMVQRWLQTSGFGDDAREFDSRLQQALDALRRWEGEARAALSVHAAECERDAKAGRPVEFVHRVGEDVCDNLNSVLDQFQDTANYLQQLAAMLRPKLRTFMKPRKKSPEEKLIDFMVDRESASEQEVVESVWGRDEVSNSNLKTTISRANKLLQAKRASFLLSQDNGRIVVVR